MALQFLRLVVLAILITHIGAFRVGCSDNVCGTENSTMTCSYVACKHFTVPASEWLRRVKVETPSFQGVVDLQHAPAVSFVSIQHLSPFQSGHRCDSITRNRLPVTVTVENTGGGSKTLCPPGFHSSNPTHQPTRTTETTTQQPSPTTTETSTETTTHQPTRTTETTTETTTHQPSPITATTQQPTHTTTEAATHQPTLATRTTPAPTTQQPAPRTMTSTKEPAPTTTHKDEITDTWTMISYVSIGISSLCISLLLLFALIIAYRRHALRHRHTYNSNVLSYDINKMLRILFILLLACLTLLVAKCMIQCVYNRLKHGLCKKKKKATPLPTLSPPEFLPPPPSAWETTFTSSPETLLPSDTTTSTVGWATPSPVETVELQPVSQRTRSKTAVRLFPPN